MVMNDRSRSMLPIYFFSSRYCSFDFRGHAEGSPCSRDSLWLSLLQGSSDFSHVSKVPQVKNCLFPTKASASVQALNVCQLGQDVCSAGNTFEKGS